jgi:hypothetical protein
VVGLGVVHRREGEGEGLSSIQNSLTVIGVGDNHVRTDDRKHEGSMKLGNRKPWSRTRWDAWKRGAPIKTTVRVRALSTIREGGLCAGNGIPTRGLLVMRAWPGLLFIPQSRHLRRWRWRT